MTAQQGLKLGSPGSATVTPLPVGHPLLEDKLASHTVAVGQSVMGYGRESGIADMQSVQGSDKQKLQAAFEHFNLMSEQLTEAYQDLQRQVQDLTVKLASAEQRREHEVAAKQRVAGKLEGLLNVLPVGVVVLDVRGYVQDCNPAAVAFLGEPLKGERWLDIISRSFAPKLDDGHEVSLRDGRRVSIATRSLDDEPGQLIANANSRCAWA